MSSRKPTFASPHEEDQPAVTAQRLDRGRFEFEVASSAWLTSDRWAKKMKIFYPAPQSVSIWVGTFPSEDAFDRASDRDVEARLKLPTSLAAIAEVTFEEEAIPIRRLLEGFGGWESFIEEASEACAAKVANANAALVCYHLRCTDAPDLWGELTFLGTFSGTDVT